MCSCAPAAQARTWGWAGWQPRAPARATAAAAPQGAGTARRTAPGVRSRLRRLAHAVRASRRRRVRERVEGRAGWRGEGAHAQVRMHAWKQALAHTHIHTHTPANKCAHACTHTHTHTRTGACMSSRKTLHDHQKRACTHARMHLSSREPVCAMYACPTQPAPVQTDAHRLRMQTWVHTRTSAHVHSHAHTHSVTHAPA